jgi:hypothetical protein
MFYSTQDVPYGFPRDKGKWRLSSLYKVQVATTSNANYGSYNGGGNSITVPVGSWDVGYFLPIYTGTTTKVSFQLSPTALSGADETGDARFTTAAQASAAATSFVLGYTKVYQQLTSANTYVIYSIGATTSAGLNSDGGLNELFAELAYI